MPEKQVYTLQIDKDFKNLITPLSRQELLQLEENILADGCLTPIVVWNGFIVDGHNRYSICTTHNVPFAIVELQMETREEVVSWICKNQLGRRNISDETRRYLIGVQYEAEKITNSKKTTKKSIVADDVEDQQVARYISRHKTAIRIGNDNNISHASVEKYGHFANALQVIGEKHPELMSKILSGKYKLSMQNVLKIAELDAVSLDKLSKKLERFQRPYVQYNRGRASVSEFVEPEVGRPSVKDMPTFDPDAKITELTLTIPSWTQSVEHTYSHMDVNLISSDAKVKFISVVKDHIAAIALIQDTIKETM